MVTQFTDVYVTVLNLVHSPVSSSYITVIFLTFSYIRHNIGGIWHVIMRTLQWRHNGHNSVSNHQPHDCLLNRLFRRKSNKTSKLRVTGLCAGNSPVTGEFHAQMASNAENVSVWWRHHGVLCVSQVTIVVQCSEWNIVMYFRVCYNDISL